MFHIKVVDKIKTHVLCSATFFPKIVPFMRMSKNVAEPHGHRQYGGALHAG